jgi:hypothetical protein
MAKSIATRLDALEALKPATALDPGAWGEDALATLAGLMRSLGAPEPDIERAMAERRRGDWKPEPREPDELDALLAKMREEQARLPRWDR